MIEGYTELIPTMAYVNPEKERFILWWPTRSAWCAFRSPYPVGFAAARDADGHFHYFPSLRAAARYLEEHPIHD